MTGEKGSSGSIHLNDVEKPCSLVHKYQTLSSRVLGHQVHHQVSTDHVGHPVSQVQESADHVRYPVSLAYVSVDHVGYPMSHAQVHPMDSSV